MKKWLSHISVFCEDIQASIRFYNDLGFPYLYGISGEDGTEWCIFLKITDGQYIELQQVNCPANPHPHPRQAYYYADQSLWHFALETDDLAEWIEDIRGKGIRVWKDPDKNEEVFSIEDVFFSEDKIYCVWVVDPDGNPFEVQQALPESPRKK